VAIIHRAIIRTISGLLSDNPIVLVEGPPRCGKSTIARQLAASTPSGAILADARLREGRALLAAPNDVSAARPVILDNASERDYSTLAAWADGGAIGGQGDARRPRFVLVGGPFRPPRASRPASPLAPSRTDAPALEAGPFRLFEAGRASVRRLWLRGGYPEAYCASSDEAALSWLEGYAADIACAAGAPRGRADTTAFFAGLLEEAARHDGEAFNENGAARLLGVSRPTIVRAAEYLERAGVLLSLPAYGAENGPASRPGVRRIARSPALYLRDSGLYHALIGVRSADELAMRPREAAASWTGFVVAQAMAALPEGAAISRYSSADGAALDIVVERDGRPVVTAVARRYRPSSVERSISYAARTPSFAGAERFIVVPDGEERQLSGGFVVSSLGSFLERLSSA